MATTSATSSSSWMPLRGKCPVQVGSSLTKHLNSRAGNSRPVKSKFDRDFYAFKYNHKPPSIDTSRPGTLHVKQGQESTSVYIEYNSTQPGEIQPFSGGLAPAKDYECVLIYDEETGTCIIEKLDSLLTLQHERKKVQQNNSHVPTPAPPPQPPLSKDSKRAIDVADQLEQELLREAEEDNDMEEIPIRMPPKAEEEEEEEEEEEIIPIPAPPRIPEPPPQSTPASASTSKSKPRYSNAIPQMQSSIPQIPAKRRPESTAPTPPVVASQAKTSQSKGKKQKTDPTLAQPAQLAPNEVEEEVLEFGKPTKRSKREVAQAVPMSPPPNPGGGGLALPGSGSFPSFALPSAPTISAKVVAPAPAAQASAPGDEDSDEDVEWERVEDNPARPEEEEEEDGDIFGGDDDNFLDDALQSENRSDEEEDEDFLANEMAIATPEVASRKPISMADLAGAAEDYSEESDDDTSSDDTSDDDD